MIFKMLNKIIVPTFLLVVLLLGECEAGETKRHITLAILPCYDVIMIFKKFHPLTTYLKDRTGYDVRIVVPTELEAIKSAIQAEEVDFIFQDVHTYLQLENLLDKDAIIQTIGREGTAVQQGVIIVRKDSGIRM